MAALPEVWGGEKGGRTDAVSSELLEECSKRVFYSSLLWSNHSCCPGRTSCGFLSSVAQVAEAWASTASEFCAGPVPVTIVCPPPAPLPL